MTQRFEKCPELPAPPARIAAFAVVALAAGISAALWIDRPRGPQCTGLLAARTTYVTAESEGTLAEFVASEGQVVGIGDPLIRLTDDRLERSTLAKRREIVALESELQRSLAAADLELRWRMRTLDSEICEVQLRSASFLKEKFDYDLQRNMLSDLLAGRDLVMLDGGGDSVFESIVLDRKAPRPERLTTVLHLEAAANASEVSSAQVEICELQQRRLEQLKQELPAQVRKTMGVDVAEANLARARDELEQLEAERQGLIIRSPAIGRVGIFRVRRGDHLSPGTPVVELLDEAQRYLIIEVPSQEIAAFGVGADLVVTFPAKVQRSGRVVSIAPQANPPQARFESSGDATIRIHAEQTGRLWPDVPVGSQVRVRPERG